LLKMVFHLVTLKVFVPIFGNLRLAAVGEWNRIGKKVIYYLETILLLYDHILLLRCAVRDWTLTSSIEK
jgi:hypothetical protein